MANMLIVAGDGTLARLVELSLIRLGHEVQIAESGEAAISLLSSGGYEAVLLDDSLPDMGAVEILGQPRGKGETRTGFMVLTSDLSPENLSECLSAGAGDLVVKPFNLPELLIRLEKLTGAPVPG